MSTLHGGAPLARPDAPTRRQVLTDRLSSFRRRHGWRRLLALVLAAASLASAAASRLGSAADRHDSIASSSAPGDDLTPSSDASAADRFADTPLGPAPDERTLTLPLPLAPPLVTAGQEVDLVAVALSDDWLVADADVIAEATVVAIDDAGLTVVCTTDEALAVVAALAVGTVEVLGR